MVGPRASRALAGALAAALACALAHAPARAAPPTEYEVKAACLYHFARYCEWPAAAFDAPDAPVVIGVLGDDPFGAALDAAVDGRTAGGRKIVVKRFQKAQDCRHVHVLFVASPAADDLRNVLAGLGDAPVLTVGDAPRFAERGGVAGFVKEEARVGFKINRAAAARAQLTLSSKLLKLAVLVPDESGGD